jgi:hypothetical protein
MFAAGRMVLRVFLGSHGTLVAVSAPFMMPLRDSDIPMNVPFTFSNKQPLHLFIGTQFSNLYTAVDMPARDRVVTLQFAVSRAST